MFNLGTDRSYNLLELCNQRDQDFQLFHCDSLKLPVRDNIFDSVISIAVIHHFSTKTLRLAAISEFHRILKVGGRVLIYVWAYEQENKVFKTQDVFVAWHLQDKYEEADQKGKESPEAQQQEESKESSSTSSFIETAIRAEDKKATVYHRYYHVFKEGELEELITEGFAGKLEIRERYYDHANWVVCCEKIA